MGGASEAVKVIKNPHDYHLPIYLIVFMHDRKEVAERVCATLEGWVPEKVLEAIVEKFDRFEVLPFHEAYMVSTSADTEEEARKKLGWLIKHQKEEASKVPIPYATEMAILKLVDWVRVENKKASEARG